MNTPNDSSTITIDQTTTTTDWSPIQKHFDNKPDDCPHCGRCKHCGRGGQEAYPIYPWYPTPYVPSPWDSYPTWIVSTSNSPSYIS